jgi:rhodanese-related sulfurtransferase/rubrerythrin
VSIRTFFNPTPSWTAEQVRDYLQAHHPEDFNLLDIGLPQEYEKGHLPGARLIPLEEIEDRLGELDAGKPTIVYSRSGLRSRSAASVLLHAGFADVHFLEGGLQAWQGEVAQGLPAAELDYFAVARSAEEHVALAWMLEEGARVFYAALTEVVQDRQSASLFRELAEAEEHHKATLLALYEGLTGRPAPPDFPAGAVADPPPRVLMEGGMAVDEAMEWIEGRQVRDILALSMALETNAYDRYLILRRELSDENARRVFEVLSDEERRHLSRLGKLLSHFV